MIAASICTLPDHDDARLRLLCREFRHVAAEMERHERWDEGAPDYDDDVCVVRTNALTGQQDALEQLILEIEPVTELGRKHRAAVMLYGLEVDLIDAEADPLQAQRFAALRALMGDFIIPLAKKEARQ